VGGYFIYNNTSNVSTLSSLSSQANLKYSANVVFNSCISDTQGIPLKALVAVYNGTTKRQLSVAINLSEVSFSKNVPANITTLPGPISNYSFTTGTSYSGPVYKNGCANDMFNNAIECNSATLFENGSLDLMLSQKLNHPIYITQLTCFSSYTNNLDTSTIPNPPRTINSNNGTANGIPIGYVFDRTNESYISNNAKVNGAFNVLIPCYNNRGTFPFSKGEHLNATILVQFRNSTSNTLNQSSYDDVWLTAITNAR
jgi:hypothetical protein